MFERLLSEAEGDGVTVLDVTGKEDVATEVKEKLSKLLKRKYEI